MKKDPEFLGNSNSVWKNKKKKSSLFENNKQVNKSKRRRRWVDYKHSIPGHESRTDD